MSPNHFMNNQNQRKSIEKIPSQSNLDRQRQKIFSQNLNNKTSSGQNNNNRKSIDKI